MHPGTYRAVDGTEDENLVPVALGNIHQNFHPPTGGHVLNIAEFQELARHREKKAGL